MPLATLFTGDVAQRYGDQDRYGDPHTYADPDNLLIYATVAFSIVVGAVYPDFTSDSSTDRHLYIFSSRFVTL